MVTDRQIERYLACPSRDLRSRLEHALGYPPTPRQLDKHLVAALGQPGANADPRLVVAERIAAALGAGLFRVRRGRSAADRFDGCQGRKGRRQYCYE